MVDAFDLVILNHFSAFVSPVPLAARLSLKLFLRFDCTRSYSRSNSIVSIALGTNFSVFSFCKSAVFVRTIILSAWLNHSGSCSTASTINSIGISDDPPPSCIDEYMLSLMTHSSPSGFSNNFFEI